MISQATSTAAGLASHQRTRTGAGDCFAYPDVAALTAARRRVSCLSQIEVQRELRQ
jgi:hypothetical protein